MNCNPAVIILPEVPYASPPEGQELPVFRTAPLPASASSGMFAANANVRHLLSGKQVMRPNPHRRIQQWAAEYSLTTLEIQRLRIAMLEYPPADIEQELKEELRCILAARELAGKPELTNEQVDRAKEAFESGRVQFVQQDMD